MVGFSKFSIIEIASVSAFLCKKRETLWQATRRSWLRENMADKTENFLEGPIGLIKLNKGSTLHPIIHYGQIFVAKMPGSNHLKPTLAIPLISIGFLYTQILIYSQRRGKVLRRIRALWHFQQSFRAVNFFLFLSPDRQSKIDMFNVGV